MITNLSVIQDVALNRNAHIFYFVMKHVHKTQIAKVFQDAAVRVIAHMI